MYWEIIINKFTAPNSFITSSRRAVICDQIFGSHQRYKKKVKIYLKSHNKIA